MVLTADYRRLVGELAEAARRRDDDLEAAEQSYVDDVAALRAAATSAERAHDDALARVAAATDAVQDTDLAAERLWADLRGQLGWHGRRLPAAPPAAVALPGSAALDRVALLATVEGRIVGYCRSRRPGAAVPAHAMPVLALIGAAVAVGVGLVAGGLATVGGVAFSVLAGVSFLLAPLAGLPLARWWTLRRYDAGLDTGAVGLTVLGGMIACTALVLILR